MDAPSCPRARFPQSPDKGSPVRVTAHNRLAPIPAIQQMIDPAFKLHACFARHSSVVSANHQATQQRNYEADPFCLRIHRGDAACC
jgi:hypothetical protein